MKPITFFETKDWDVLYKEWEDEIWVDKAVRMATYWVTDEIYDMVKNQNKQLILEILQANNY